jgi:hypothetical protein
MRPDVTGEDVVRKVEERVAALRKTLKDIEAEIERRSAAQREHAEQLRRSIAAIQAEIAQRERRVIEQRTETSRRDHQGSPARDAGARASARAP